MLIRRANKVIDTAARCDRSSGRVIVDLENGCTFAFPPHLAQRLEAAASRANGAEGGRPRKTAQR